MVRGLNAVVVDVVESFRSKKAAAVLMVFLFEGVIKSSVTQKRGEKRFKIFSYLSQTKHSI